MENHYTVLNFYRFLHLTHLETLKLSLTKKLTALNVQGRILIASEGINGTLAIYGHNGDKTLTDTLTKIDSKFNQLHWTVTYGKGEKLPFVDLFIKITNELIGTGLLGKGIFDDQRYSDETYGGLSADLTGVHLTPHEFHASLLNCNSGKKNILIDVRNDIEYQVGHFKDAIGLKTSIYSESWKSFDKILVPYLNDIKNKKANVLMYCTGGIRCEKASAYLIKQGIDRESIFQLKGGIHRYLEAYPSGIKLQGHHLESISSDYNATETDEEGLFIGKNYIFDQRVLISPEEYGTSAIASAPRSSSSRSQDTAFSALSSAAGVAGRCLYCGTAYDLVRQERVCCVCRHDVLICDVCTNSCPYPGEFHCAIHSHLRDCYVKRVELCSLETLELHNKRLMEEYAKIADGKEQKNRRRTLRNQLEKVALEMNNRTATAVMRQCSTCNGNLDDIANYGFGPDIMS